MQPAARLSWPIRAICAALMLALQPALIPSASAAPNDTGSSAAQATIAVIRPASIIKLRDMVFGNVASQPTAGNVVLDAATDTCTTTNGLVRVGTCQSAQFAGMGVRNMLVRINGPTSIQLTGPGQPIVLDNFLMDTSPDLQAQSGGGGSGPGNGNGNGNGNAYGWSNAPGQGNRRFRIVSTGGLFNFGVGGTLHVNANQVPGHYAGSFSVTVIYQ